MDKIYSGLILTLFLFNSFATTFVMPTDGDIIGDIDYVYPQEGETLGDIGIRYDMGYYEMVHANPHIDPLNLLPSGVPILIPSQFILPSAPRQGLVINLAEYRLYFFPENDNVVMTFPVGIGRKGWSTPLGKTTVVAKQKNPSWHPSAKLRAHAERSGVQLPDTFPPDSGNPLGKHVLRLGWPTYLIHGANHAEGIGERISAGCIRMLAEDMEYLFNYVKVGTTVQVVNEPTKLGHLNGAWYVEAHPPLSKQKKASIGRLEETIIKNRLNQHPIQQAMAHPIGVPKKLM